MYVQLSMEKHLTDTQTSYVTAGAPMLIDEIKLTSTAFTAHDTNKYTFEITVGGTVVAQRDTNVAGGDLVADTAETLTLQNTDKLSLVAGSVIKCAVSYTH